MSLTSKITCLAVLLTSFLLILATGRSNIRNYEKVQSSIEGMYKDRLLVKGLIYELSSHLHAKELAVASHNLTFFTKSNDSVNAKIENHLHAFRKTKLTKKEEITLNRFSEGVEKLKAAEKEIAAAEKSILTGADYRRIKAKIVNLKKDLQVLSGIQLEEGQKKLRTGKHAVEQMNEFAYLETIGLILIGIMMIALIFIPGADKSVNQGHKV